MYPECFYGIGRFKDYEYHFTIEDNAKPVSHPLRNIPLALQHKLNKELDEMVEQGIATPVNELSVCINALLIHKKPNGRLRTCLDAKDFHKIIKREHHHVPTMDIIPKMMWIHNLLQG